MKYKIITDQSLLIIPSKEIYTNEWNKTFKALESMFDVKKMSGLAAIQVGIKKHAFLARFNGMIRRFANAKILEKSPGTEIAQETCLSIPDKVFNVERSETIIVTDDINGRMILSDEYARIFQHEYDHCMGLTLVQTGVESEVKKS